MTQDRRASARVPVEFMVDERSGSDLYLQRATNLSLGGLYLDGTLPHPPGTSVTLDLHVPDGHEPLRVAGVVVDAPRSLGMSVRFGALSAGSSSRIARYLGKRRFSTS